MLEVDVATYDNNLTDDERGMLDRIIMGGATAYFSWSIPGYYLVLPDGTHDWYPDQAIMSSLVDKGYFSQVSQEANGADGATGSSVGSGLDRLIPTDLTLAYLLSDVE
jgi:hypothetical protein